MSLLYNPLKYKCTVSLLYNPLKYKCHCYTIHCNTNVLCHCYTIHWNTNVTVVQSTVIQMYCVTVIQSTEIQMYCVTVIQSTEIQIYLCHCYTIHWNTNELNILHLDRYCIPYFLLKVWYTLERFRVKRYLHASRREIKKDGGIILNACCKEIWWIVIVRLKYLVLYYKRVLTLILRNIVPCSI